MSKQQLRKLYETTPDRCWRSTERLWLDGISAMWVRWWWLRGYVELRRVRPVIGGRETFVRLTRKGRCVAHKIKLSHCTEKAHAPEHA